MAVLISEGISSPGNGDFRVVLTREMMSYFEELTRAMTWLGEKPDTIFVGQTVGYPGSAMYKTLSGVPMEKRIELPVAEEMQMGLSIGLALTGKVVISIYPRFY